MKVQGSYRIAAPLPVVWNKLMDPGVLQRAIPGCEKLERIGENRYRTTVKAGVGPVKGTFSGEVGLTDIVPQKSYNLVSRANGPVGFVEGLGSVRLEDAGPETVVHFTGDVKIGGMLASVGGRLVEAAAQKNIRDTFDNLAREAQA